MNNEYIISENKNKGLHKKEQKKIAINKIISFLSGIGGRALLL